jgi:hypothetical protein
MKRAIATMILLGAASPLSGCATTHASTTGGPLASRGESPRHVIIRDADGRAVLAAHDEVVVPAAGPREGTPTPEPALPAPDARFAGPTPQVPIPVAGTPLLGTGG